MAIHKICLIKARMNYWYTDICNLKKKERHAQIFHKFKNF